MHIQNFKSMNKVYKHIQQGAPNVFVKYETQIPLLFEMNSKVFEKTL